MCKPPDTLQCVPRWTATSQVTSNSTIQRCWITVCVNSLSCTYTLKSAWSRVSATGEWFLHSLRDSISCPWVCLIQIHCVMFLIAPGFCVDHTGLPASGYTSGNVSFRVGNIRRGEDYGASVISSIKARILSSTMKSNSVSAHATHRSISSDISPIE